MGIINLIFISGPYTNDDPKVCEYNYYEQVLYYTYLLTQGSSAVSSVLVEHPVINTNSKNAIPSSMWIQYSLDILKLCDEIHVLTIPGYESSEDVETELAFAAEHNIDIKFVTVSPTGKYKLSK